jgi:hypothetical protein
VRRAGVIGVTCPVPEEIDDTELERRLFPVLSETAAPRRRSIGVRSTRR